MKHKKLGGIKNTITAFLMIVFALICMCIYQQAHAVLNSPDVTHSAANYVQCAGGRSGPDCPSGQDAVNTDLATGSIYADMRSSFLNINSDTLSVLSFNDLSEAELSNVMSDGSSSVGLMMAEMTGSESWYAYGAKHTCENGYGETAACFLNTGGSNGGIFTGDPCGTLTGNSYANAINPSYQCSETRAWSSFNFWLNAYDNTDFIVDSFQDTPKSANRLCVEMDLPSTGLTLNSTDVLADSSINQVVNPSTLSANLRGIKFEWGSYTSPRLNSSGTTTDDEVGGTYQGGGSHFYHKPSSFGAYPTDKLYAIDSDTVVACIGDIPTGVRSGMRPSYVANPLLTIGGSDSNGETQALNYINYLTRLYFRFSDTTGSTATYPLELKINKFFVLYEENEIFAATDTGATLSEIMVENNTPAYHSFKIYNDADENRDYRVYLGFGGILPLNESKAEFMLYDDLDGDGVVDVGEPEIEPYDVLTLSANTDKSLIIKQTADFANYYHGTFERHGRMMSQATFSLQEIGTLRSASFAVRSWEGTPAEQATQAAFFETTKYPSDTSEWYLNRQFNNEKDPSTNPYLVRNTPDYIMAKTKGGW